MTEFGARLPLRHDLSESTLVAVRAYLAAFATGRTRIDETGTDLFVLFEHPDDLELLKRQFPHVIEPAGPREHSEPRSRILAASLVSSLRTCSRKRAGRSGR